MHPSRQPSNSNTVNNYVYGGIGGNGGLGGVQGGGGGMGEGASMSYDINTVENFTNLTTSRITRVSGFQWRDSTLREAAVNFPVLQGPCSTRSMRDRCLMSSSSRVSSSLRASIVAPEHLPFPASEFSTGRADPNPSSVQFPYTPQHQQPFDQADTSQNSPRPFAFDPQPSQYFHGGTFINTDSVHHGETGFHILHRAVALEALYNAAESFPQPKCHPETRVKLLDKLFGWATVSNPVHSIQWLHGPAGAGKSAVMQSLCQRLRDAERLVGSFFFKRSHQTRGNAKVLFATLAYQLAISRPELKRVIARSVGRDPSVLGRGMDVQLCSLILEPCKRLLDSTPSILLIDGLDECEGHNIHREILRLIGSAIKHHGHLLRILIASRPEPHIRETFKQKSFQGLVGYVDIEGSFEDVEAYLRAEFSRIHREHHAMRNIPTPWPSLRILEALVQNSSGYFIYASTVIKFVDDEYSRPSKQLDIILARHNMASPFEALDQLYRQILSRVPDKYRSHLCDILSVIVNYPHGALTVTETDDLLGFEPGYVSLILRPLHSILTFNSEDPGIRMHHASFRDFLHKQERSSIFYVGSSEHHAKLACSILKALAYTYEDHQKNRANLEFRWRLGEHGLKWIEYVIAQTPSMRFVPFIRRVNPDFIFCRQDLGDIRGFLLWLKTIYPVPKDLIQRWEDYHFIRLYEDFQYNVAFELLEERNIEFPQGTDFEILALSLHSICALQARMNSRSHAFLDAFRVFLSQTPRLVRILQACQLLFPSDGMNPLVFFENQLFRLRIVLNLSWEDIGGCICSLRRFISQESDAFYTLFLTVPIILQELDFIYPKAMVSRDLACGFIRLMQRIGDGDSPVKYWEILPYKQWRHSQEWGRHIRSSPQSDPKLLQTIDQFHPPWDIFSEWSLYGLEPAEFYDVVQWLKFLKQSTDPQLRMVARWESHLAESRIRAEERERYSYIKHDYSDNQLEKRWQNKLKKEAPQLPDNEVMRCWEGYMRKFPR
ncbi:hypothetical protein B0H19DRAFT_1084349 [Mycena capillaripes]|nr:hypothetical protein B0H19DRAFT_1084349 [Mycena capillaripes]